MGPCPSEALCRALLLTWHLVLMETLCDCGMVLQVQATFAGGLSEHLQAAGGANASVTASLRESLGTAAQLVDDLKTDIHEGQNKLIHLASQKSKPALCSKLPILFLQTHVSAQSTLFVGTRLSRCIDCVNCHFACLYLVSRCRLLYKCTSNAQSAESTHQNICCSK